MAKKNINRSDEEQVIGSIFSEEDLVECCNQFLSNFCELVSNECERKNISAGQLATICGVDRTALSRILKLQRKPSLETVIRLACTLGIGTSIQDLVEFRK